MKDKTTKWDWLFLGVTTLVAIAFISFMFYVFVYQTFEDLKYMGDCKSDCILQGFEFRAKSMGECSCYKLSDCINNTCVQDVVILRHKEVD
jgi:hypothetical protein